MPLRSRFSRPVFAAVLLAACAAGGPARAQEALRAPIEWKVLTTGDFEIHYPGDQFLPRAREVAAWLLAAQPKIESALDHDFEPRIRVILYRSRLEAGQHEDGDANPGRLFPLLSETRRRRIILPLEPSHRSLQRSLEFQLAQIAVQQRWYGRTSLVASVYEYKSSLYPVWLSRGIAASQAGPMESIEEMLVRDAALDRDLPSLGALHGFDHLNRHHRYPLLAQGASAVDWISRATPRGSAKRLMHVFDSDLPFPTSRHIARACGMSYGDVEDRYAAAMMEKYAPDGRREEADGYSRRAGERSDHYRAWELGAALSPDGKEVAYLEDSAEYFDLVVRDLASGEARHPLRLDLHVTLDEVHPGLRGLDWSPDGRSICFVADRAAAPVLCLVALPGSVRTLPLPFDDLASPSWSPDGASIAFVGQRLGYSDLYLLDIASGELRSLTQDPAPDSDPAWSPDGRSVAFASESDGQIDLWSVALADGTRRRLTATPHDETSPAWRPDGGALTFCADPEGIHNLYSLDLATGGLARHTDVPGGAFAPRWSSDGSTIAFTVYRHGRFQARLMSPRVASAAVPAPDPARAEIARRYTRSSVEQFEVKPYEAKIRLESVLPTNAALSDILGRHRFGVDIRYRFRSGGHDIGADATYTNRIWRPDFFIKALVNHVEEGAETEFTTGAEAGCSYPIETYTKLAGSYFIRRIDRAGQDEDDPDPDGATVEAGLRLSASRRNITRRRDNPIGGYAVSGSVEWLSPALGSDFERTTYALEGRLYFEVFQDVVIASRLGIVHSTGPDADSLNLKDRVRGYRSREPRGQDLAWLNVEVRFPLHRDVDWVLPWQIAILKDVRGSVFADLGVISDEENALNMLAYPVRDEWHYAVGATLQLDFYVLQRAYIPVIVSVAKVLDDTDEAPGGVQVEMAFELAF